MNLTKSEKLKSVVTLNEDAKQIVSNNLKGKILDGTLKLITENLIEKGYANEDELLEIILYSEGKISNKELETKLTYTLTGDEVFSYGILHKNKSDESTKKDTKGKDISIPKFIDSLDYNYWK